MKRRVVLSAYCWIISGLMLTTLVAIMFNAMRRPDGQIAAWILAAAIAFLVIFALLYMPLWISLDPDAITMRRPLKAKRIPLAEIESVRMCPPTIAAKRIWGSGGWLGWYGLFSEKDLGRYFAYYGKASDCFLVTLKSGKKYMLGCSDAPAMCAAIASRLDSKQKKH